MAALTQSDLDGVRVLRVAGALTVDEVPSLAAEFEAATPGPGPVLVDLSAVPMVTTPGLSLLLAAAQRAEKAGGRLVVTGTRGLVQDLLHRCRLDIVLPVVLDPDEALRQAQGKAGGAQRPA